MKRALSHSYRQKRRNVTIALQWLWIALGFVLLAALIAFTHLHWSLVLLFALLPPYALASFVSDLRKGESSPLVKMVLGPYRPQEAPVAFWLSVAWNVAVVVGMIVIVAASIVNGVAP